MVEAKIEEAIEAAVQVIKQSEVYAEYHKQLDIVKAEPGLKAQIDEFRMRNFELQNSENVALEQIDAFEREYDEFRENPKVSRFLAAELSFCRMMQEMQEKMVREVEFE